MRLIEPCGICGKDARTQYPGNDPENGPARPYCPDGHSTCGRCGKWFQAITKIPPWTDEETGMEAGGGESEADWCDPCVEEHGKDHCGCGADATLHKKCGNVCCGGFMCCPCSEE